MAYSRGLAFRLRELRSGRGLTQEQVAEQAGIATYTYQKFEKGESRPGTPANPNLHTLTLLADVFDMSLSDLVDIDFDGYEPNRSDAAPSDAPRGRRPNRS